MTTISEARTVVYQRWLDQWTATPFVFEGEADEDLYGGVVPWARVVYRNTEAAQKTLSAVGTRKYKRDASALISIYTQVDDGLTDAGVLAQTAKDVFEGESFGGLFFNDGVVREIGEDDGRWYITNVEVFSDYQEIK